MNFKKIILDYDQAKTQLSDDRKKLKDTLDDIAIANAQIARYTSVLNQANKNLPNIKDRIAENQDYVNEITPLIVELRELNLKKEKIEIKKDNISKKKKVLSAWKALK